MGALTTAYVAVLPDMGGFGRELKVGLRRVDVTSSGRDAGTRFSSGFGDNTKKALKRGLIGAGIAAGAAFGGALTRGFGRLSAIENAEAKLTGLGHSAKTVDKIMGNALASVKGTAFGLDEAATLAATAVASGIKPGKDLQRTLGLVADAATIGGTSLAEMGGIFSDVAASNKIQGDTINQLNERGIPILKLLGDVMGVSQGEVSKLASKGKIDFATFQKAMEKGLGGAALDSGKTATGAFKNMGAAFSRVGAALLKGVFPQIGAGFGTITGFLDKITPAAGRFGEAVGTAFSTVAGLVRDQLVPAFDGIKARALPGLQVVGDVIRANVLPALRTLGGFVLNTLLPAWLAWQAFMASQMAPILRQVGGFVVANIIPAFKAVARFIATTVVPAFLSIVETVKGLIRVVAPIIGQIVAVVLGKFNEMRPQIMQIWGSVKEIITGVMFIVKAIISRVTKEISTFWAKWGDTIKRVVAIVFPLIINVIRAAMRIIAGIIKLVVAIIKGDWSGAWNAIKQIFSGVWLAIKSIVKAQSELIRAIISGWVSRVKANWSTFWTGIKTVARDAMDAVKSKIDTVLGKIKTAFSTAKANIKKVWEGVKSVVSAPIDWIRVHVYNTPLVPVWNRVADLVGGTKLRAYASGGVEGVRPGYTPGRDTHPILVGGGEAIMRPEWARVMGENWIDQANAASRRGVSSARSFMGLEGFQGGGVVGWLKGLAGSATGKVADLASKLKGWVLGGLRSLAEKILNPIKGVIDRAMPNTGVGSTVGGIGKKAINLVLDKIKSADAAAMAASAGAPGGSVGTVSRGMAATIAAMRAAGARSFTTYPGHHPSMAKARDVTPHNWRIANVARASSSVWYVIYRMMIASKNHGNNWRPYHPISNTGDWQHTRHIHVAWYDKGGTLKPGLNLAYNGTGRDELVTPLPKRWQRDDKLDRLIALLEQRSGDVHFDFVTHNPVAEPQSVTTNKALQRVAALGLVG
jgi:tape measure domain-containing protein